MPWLCPVGQPMPTLPPLPQALAAKALGGRKAPHWTPVPFVPLKGLSPNQLDFASSFSLQLMPGTNQRLQSHQLRQQGLGSWVLEKDKDLHPTPSGTWVASFPSQIPQGLGSRRSPPHRRNQCLARNTVAKAPVQVPSRCHLLLPSHGPDRVGRLAEPPPHPPTHSPSTAASTASWRTSCPAQDSTEQNSTAHPRPSPSKIKGSS